MSIMADKKSGKVSVTKTTEVICLLYLMFMDASECYPKVVGFHRVSPPDSRMIDAPISADDDEVKGGDFSINHLPKPVSFAEDIGQEQDVVTYNDENLIPDFNEIVLTVELGDNMSKAEVLQSLRQALSRILHMPVENVQISKFEDLTGVLMFYFIYDINGEENNLGLIPASEILPKLSVEQLQNETNGMKVISIESHDDSLSYVKPTKISCAYSLDRLKSWKTAVAAVGAMLAILSLFIIAYILTAYRAVKRSSSTISEERQVVLHPVLKPNVTGVNVIQPENRDSCIAETDSEHTPSPCCSPMRVKGKGLLERRGSNASLTLDLNRSQENVHYGTPPKECSTEEYLMSAAHRLTRKQLHNCLKDVKALHSEFWEIPMNHPEKVEVAGCGTKNRYKTILPNEVSRVHLKSVGDDPLASYINANYIRGYGGEKNAYIATQGPMAHTIDDFWIMVWEQKCPIIVMITKLKEKFKIKCESYLPDCVGHYSGIEVTVLREIPRDGYTIRELLMKKGRETHNVCHFWYTAWPDHKTPDTAKQLLSMALEVEALRHHGNDRVKGPTVVHCSAGIGRTGCFIAISTGIKQLMEEDLVDVLGIVCGLRLDRGGMVQTAEQYEFVHQALSVFESTMTDHSGE